VKKRTPRTAWWLSAVLALALLGGASVPYVWWRLPDAVVSLDGRPTTLPVYRSYDGQLLLWTSETTNAPFIIDPAGNDVAPVGYQPLLGDLTETNHFFVGTNFALIMDDGYRPRAVRAYYEGNRQATVREGYVEFYAEQSTCVRVKF
jgi:hypothetical protein